MESVGFAVWRGINLLVAKDMVYDLTWDQLSETMIEQRRGLRIRAITPKGYSTHGECSVAVFIIWI
jgi:hypothetical protein